MVQNVTLRHWYTHTILICVWGQAVLGHKRRWMDCFFDVAWFASFSCLLCYSTHGLSKVHGKDCVRLQVIILFVCNSSKMPTRITITNYTTALLLLHWKWNSLFFSSIYSVASFETLPRRYSGLFFVFLFK